MLEVESLQAGIENAVKDIDKMSEQLSAVQRAVRDFHSLDDALKGQGGEAIRSFYKDCHEPFLIYLHQSFIDYKTILNEMKEAIDSFEANPSGYVKQEYLESDVEDGLDTVENTTVELTADANSIIDSISDLVAIKSIDESEVIDNVGRGKEKSAEIVEELNILDDYSTSRLEETKQDLQLMSSYISEIESRFKSGDLSVRNYSVESIKDLTAHEAIMDSIYNQDQTTISAMYGENIDKMPMSEIEKMKDELLGSLDKNGQEFLNSVYTDLENGDIDRETFKIIMQELNGTEVSEMDSDSRAYLEKVYEDYKNEEVDTKTFTSVVSGVVSTGSKFIEDVLKNAIEGQAIDVMVEGTAKWIKETTELFVNPELVPMTTAGATTSITLTSKFKDVLRNVYDFGAKRGPGLLGSAIDFTSQVIAGEDWHHAGLKTLGHIGTGTIGRVAGTALVAGATAMLGVTIGAAGTVVIGVAVGTAAAYAFDWAYDKWGRDIVNSAVDVGKNVVEGIGNAVSGFFGGLKSAFS